MRTRKPFWSLNLKQPVSINQAHAPKIQKTVPRILNGTRLALRNNFTEQITYGGSMAKFAARLTGSSGIITKSPGEKTTAWVEFINTGTETWDSGVRLGSEGDRY